MMLNLLMSIIKICLGYLFLFNDPRIPELKRRYKVSGIPRLVIIDPATGNTICDDGRMRVELDLQGNEFPWPKNPIDDINRAPGSILNEETVLMVLDPNLSNESLELLRFIAIEYKEKWKTHETQPLYFMYGTSGNMFNRVQSFLKLTTQYPALVILDIQGQSKYIQQSFVITEENIRKEIEDFVDQKKELSAI